VTTIDADEPNIVWNDGHWWWWNGTEWLLGTDAGWQRQEVATSALETAEEPASMLDQTPLLIPPEPISEEVATEAQDVFQIAPATPDPGSRRVSRGFWIAIAAVALIAIGGGTWLWVTGNPAANGGSPNPSTSESARTLSALGMTFLDWNGVHKVAPGYPAGTAYDPDPTLPPSGGAVGARYTKLVVTDNLVLSFRVNFVGGSTMGTTNLAVTRILPTDANLINTQILATCAIRQFNSPTLGRAIGSANHNGEISVVMRSGTVTFDLSNVAFADVTATASPITNCS
jgi:hypothetical protein